MEKSRRAESVCVRLTPRERQVADALLRGDKRDTIASELGIHVRTVDFHISALREKTQGTSFALLIIALTRKIVGN